MNHALYGVYTDPTYLGVGIIVAIAVAFFAVAWYILSKKR